MDKLINNIGKDFERLGCMLEESIKAGGPEGEAARDAAAAADALMRALRRYRVAKESGNTIPLFSF